LAQQFEGDWSRRATGGDPQDVTFGQNRTLKQLLQDQRVGIEEQAVDLQASGSSRQRAPFAHAQFSTRSVVRHTRFELDLDDRVVRSFSDESFQTEQRSQASFLS
jgi:hypothetical protein